MFTKLISAVGAVLALLILIAAFEEGGFKGRYGGFWTAVDDPVRFWLTLIVLILFFIAYAAMAWPERRDEFPDDAYYRLEYPADNEEDDSQYTNTDEQELKICNWVSKSLKLVGVETKESDEEYVGAYHEAKYKGKLYLLGFTYYSPYRGIGKPTVDVIIRRYVCLFGDKLFDKKVGADDPFLGHIKKLTAIVEKKFHVAVEIKFELG